MDTVTDKGRAYLAVAGSDDGVTLLDIVLDGRFRHVGTVEDAVETMLDTVSALNLSLQGDALHLAVMSPGEAGLPPFHHRSGRDGKPFDRRQLQRHAGRPCGQLHITGWRR